jgi:hypothetical protein
MGAPTCGVAWNEGAARARGDYLHWTADDLVPEPGWDVPAVTAAAGAIPAPVTLRPDGTRRELRRLLGPDLRTDDHGDRQHRGRPVLQPPAVAAIGPHLDCHYYTDNWFTHRARRAGYPVLVRSDYAFTHHWAQPGRGAGMTEEERMAHDREIYERAVAEDRP